MARYIEGFVLPVPKRKLKEYLKLARLVGKIWLEHGTLKYVECMADDTPWGKRTSFPRSVKLKKGEVVFLSWAEFKSRKHHDKVMAAAMKDPRMKPFMDSKKMPFDGKRMFWGGFKPLVDLKARGVRG